MKRILLIDGENLKGKIKTVFENQEEFAHIKKHPQSIEKSKRLIEEQRPLKTHLERSGFKVTMAGNV